MVVKVIKVIKFLYFIKNAILVNCEKLRYVQPQNNHLKYNTKWRKELNRQIKMELFKSPKEGKKEGTQKQKWKTRG